MYIFFLILSAILFIGTFGIHMIITNSDPFDKPVYTRDPFLSALPWISGFIMPVIPFAIIIDFHWLLILICNAILVYILGPILTKGIHVRFASGKGYGKDMLNYFIAGIIFLVIGLLIK